jgi:DNA-binding SARP family transcriptional activator
MRLIVCFSAAHTFDSDDDEDSVPEIDADTAYRRSAELLFSSDLDEERSMAAMRGALAAGKRVPSKEALASLEVVKVEDLEIMAGVRRCIWTILPVAF